MSNNPVWDRNYPYNLYEHTIYYAPSNNIKKVIFNGPATIIFWDDGSKTLVKCTEKDTFDYEKGLAMAIAKKNLGNDFRKTFKKWLPKESKKIEHETMSCENCSSSKLCSNYADGNHLCPTWRNVNGK